VESIYHALAAAGVRSRLVEVALLGLSMTLQRGSPTFLPSCCSTQARQGHPGYICRGRFSSHVVHPCGKMSDNPVQ